ncbi:MAG: phosphatase PAP2 family protein [Polyangiaceae bacterium]
MPSTIGSRTFAAISLASSAAFAGIALAVSRDVAGVVETDESVARTLHENTGELGIGLFRGLTFFGDVLALTIASVTAVVLLLVRKKRAFATGVGGSMLGVAILNEGLKRSFARPRPSFPDPIAFARGYSFPSGHSMGTLVFVTLLLFIGFHRFRSPRTRLLMITVGAIWTLAMGLSRMYLGVHYATDVLAGFTAGLAWSAACIALLVRATST